MTWKSIAAITFSSILLLGCAMDAGPKEQSGAVLGGLAGGLIGNSVGQGNGRAAATVLGVALGAVVGGAVGRSLDDQDRERAYLAAQQGLADDQEEAWDNPDTGHRGRFVPRRTYYNAERALCRDFEHTIWVNGQPEVIDGTACQLADGSWRVVG